MSSTVTITKDEYATLAPEASAYRALAGTFARFQAERAVDDVVANFSRTKKYSENFLEDLRDGLTDLRKSKAWKSK